MDVLICNLLIWKLKSDRRKQVRSFHINNIDNNRNSVIKEIF